MDWSELRERFKYDYQASGVSLKQWCNENGVDYTSARKQIRVREIKAAMKCDHKTKRQNVTMSQPNKLNHTSFTKGNQLARTHGGYASLLNYEDVELASKIQGLEDELLASRSRVISIIKSRAEIERQWKRSDNQEERAQLAEIMIRLVDAEDRAVARVESLTATVSKIERNCVSNHKDTLQSELIKQTINSKAQAARPDDKVIYNIDW